jgi:hypothetical protein
MNIEPLYRYVMDSAVLFFSGWVVVLGWAFALAFVKSTN